MYELASAAITVERSRRSVFEYAANLENFPSWFPGVVEVVADDELPFATVGKRYRETALVPLRGTREVTIRVVDTAAPERIATEGDLPVLLPRMEIELHELGPNSCELRWRMFSRNTDVLARRTLLPFARWVMGRRATIGLRNLKRLLERDDAANVLPGP
jgi:hypothetical protein